MNQGQQRIPCPRCRANNFLGTTHCWQCGGSLPPPEVVGQVTMPVPAPPPSAHPSPNTYYPPPYDAAAVRRSSRRLMLIPLVFLLVIGLGALFVIAFQSRHGAVMPGLDDAQARMNAYADRLRREMDDSTAESGDIDPLTAQARREIERLSEQVGGLGPPSDPQGRVHLRSGGTISREQWERARDSLRATP